MNLNAKDLGVYGATSNIIEEDLICYIQEKIKKLSEEEHKDFMQAMQDHFITQLKKPMEVKGIEKTKSYSVTYYDPSISVEHDILDHEGKVIVKNGTHFNPLSQAIIQDLIFFDSTDANQLSWALSLPPSVKWILVKGKPMELEEKLNRPVYFDQNGVLTEKFGIHQVPARISQEGLRLKIEFIPVGG